jgi:predicted restriction endonuclease
MIGLIGTEATMIAGRGAAVGPDVIAQSQNADVEVWEHHIEDSIESDTQIPETDREALIVARRGQGLFKQRVMQIEHCCRVTGVLNPTHLRASHSKPWRDSSNEERLDGENGLLLTPTIDHLFDRGFISFEDSGKLIVPPVAHTPSLNRMGVATDRVVNVGTFTIGQGHYLEYHRDSVLLQAAR